MSMFNRFLFTTLYILWIVSLIAYISATLANAAPPLKVAIIDTGLDRTDVRFAAHLCPSGHYNFVDHNEDTHDNEGHGTYIAGLIQKYAKSNNYCLIIYKFYNDTMDAGTNSFNSILAIRMAVKEGAEIVNMSYGGKNFIESEYLAIKDAPTVTFIAAAGNNGIELNKTGYFYPASYDLPNVIAVGGLKALGGRLKDSNYGDKVKVWELGDGPLGPLPGGNIGAMIGTSISAAIYTGRLISVKGLHQ